ncbi:MAG: class I SAM-dependent methyltransferase [Myxococcota bacterium]
MSLSSFIRRSEADLRKLKLDRPPLAYVCQMGFVRDRREGLWLEFGTGTGSTTKVMCDARQSGKVHTFDWFQGLPTDWIPEYGVYEGAFAQPAPTDLPPNAELVKGRFEDTLEPFLSAHPNQPVDLVHIDCDVYDSTRFVLEALTPRLTSGTVLVFDELFYYPGRENHEAKALFEWQRDTGHRFAWIGTHGQQRAIDVVSAANADPALRERDFVGPDRRIIAHHVPVMDRAALVLC